jgi:hypothetical protein
MAPTKFVNIVGRIIELKECINERKRKKDLAKRFTDLENTAKFQSVKYSNMLDDITVPDERINEIVNHDGRPSKIINTGEYKIAGYRDALALVHNEYATLDVCEKDIRQLDQTLWAYSSFYTGGIYNKRADIAIKSNVPITKIMGEFVRAYTAAQNNCNIHSLLLIPCVILDFLCICPFEIENGRMSRLLAQLLLCKNGFDVVRYISFGEYLIFDRFVYDEAIQASSSGWLDNTNHYIPFIDHFISTVLSCYTELDKHFPQVNRSSITKRQRIEDTVLNSMIPISKSDICSILPDVSPTTVEKYLGVLLKSGLIKIIGAGTKTKYIKNDDKKE